VTDKTKTLTLLSILCYLHCSDATDPRDKIYATLPALVDGQLEDLKSDYSLSVADVYKNLAVHLIKRNSDLHILNYCHLSQKISVLPSGVPDWAAENLPYPFTCYQRLPDGSYTQTYNTSLRTKIFAQFSPDKRRLRIHGTLFDEIVSVSRARVNRRVYGGLDLDLTANWMEVALEGGGVYVTDRTKMEALQHTVCTDQDITDSLLATGGESINWPDSVRSSQILNQTTHYRRLIRTSRYNLGIASYDTLLGDIVCILFSGSMPIILRPVDDHFLFVGECYVHGVMNGEALDGVDLEKDSRTFEIW
jgi:hypothetical protein